MNTKPSPFPKFGFINKEGVGTVNLSVIKVSANTHNADRQQPHAPIQDVSAIATILALFEILPISNNKNNI